MIGKISCMIKDGIKYSLSTCDYRDSNEICYDYLMGVSHECQIVFNNEVYLELWKKLLKFCNDIGEQSSPFYLDK
jgi:hypothetical protein